MLREQAFFDDATNTVTYLVWDSESLDAVVIDAVLDYEPQAARLETGSADHILSVIAEKALKLVRVLDTHAHADHLSAGHYIREKTGARLGIGAGIIDVQSTFRPMFLVGGDMADAKVFDDLFEDGDEFYIGVHPVTVMHTPGHTSACITYMTEDMAFVGDTLFMPDYGTARTDFPGGDAARLYGSIQRILSLPDKTRIMVGHDYLPEGREDYRWESTVAEQRGNIHLRGKSESDYVKMRETRDATLQAPRLILPSLQVNIRGGGLPSPDEDGHIYLTIPVNRI